MAVPERPKSSWVQSNLGATVVGGVILIAPSIVVNALLENIDGSTRLIIIGGIAVVALVITSYINKNWREATWAAWRRWLKGLGILTNRKRIAIEQEGYDRRSSEVDHERAFVKQPAWRIDARDALGERNLFWLNNHGHAATEVRVTVDPEFFVPEGEIFWASFSGTTPGGSIGAWFKGQATDRGKAEGVTFHVSWRDETGDAQATDVFMSADEIRAGQNEAIDDAWARGRADGRQELLDEQAAAGPQPPLPQPRWLIQLGGFGDSRGTPFVIENLEARSVAREVRVDANPSSFTFVSGATWAEMSGESRKEFKGIMSQDAQAWGLVFTISWYDEKNERQEATFAYHD